MSQNIENGIEPEQDSTKKKIGKNKMLIELKNSNTCNKIEVTAPKTIRMNVIQTLLIVRFGLPPMDVSPIDWKGLFHILGAFALLIVCIALNAYPIFIGIGILLLIYNFYINMNYFRHFISRKLSEGYSIDNPEQLKAVTEAKALAKTPLEKKRSFIIRIIIILVLIAAIGFTLISGGEDYTAKVRDGYLEAFGTDYTIGEVFDVVSGGDTTWTQEELSDPRWPSEYYKLVNASWYGEGGEVVVQFIVEKEGSGLQLHGAAIGDTFIDAMDVIIEVATIFAENQ